VVNIGHISRLAKTRRDHKVVLQRFNVELPVSRSRFKDLLPRLKVAGVGK
jgi:DNA-binding LytR/AlgR family response regulator